MPNSNFSARLIERAHSPPINQSINHMTYNSYKDSNQSINHSYDSSSPDRSSNPSINQVDGFSVHDQICEVNDSKSASQSVSQSTNHNPRWLFKWLLLTESLMYLQAGATPAVLTTINQSFNLSFGQQGMIGGLMYLCLSLMCPLTGYAIYKYNQSINQLIGISLLMHALSTAAFGLVPAPYDPTINQSIDLSINPSINQYILIALRGSIGACQSLLIVLGPLWVNHFSPISARSRWMSALQASVPFGIMAGYLIATICMGFEIPSINQSIDQSVNQPIHPSIVNHGSELFETINLSIGLSINQDACYLFSCWRWPFVLQAFLTFPLAIACFTYLKREDVDVTVHRSSINQSISQSSLNQPINQSINQSVDAASPLSKSQANQHSSYQSTDSFSEHQPLNQSYHSNLSINQHQSINQNQSITEIPITTFDALYELSQNRIYVCIVLSLCCLYFVVTGVQFWSTAYLLDVMHGDRQSIRWTFIGVCATAPIFGVIAGGMLIDARRDAQNEYRSINQSNDHHSINQSISHSHHSTSHSNNQSMNDPNQSINHSVDQSINGSVDQSVNQSIDQSFNRSVNESIDQSLDQSLDQSIDGADLVNALETCLMFGLIACIACVPITLTDSIPVSVGCMWFLLFFGGCCMPGVMGCMIGCCRVNVRPWASSSAVIMFNILGYCASPILSGWVMSGTGSMTWGFRFVLAASFGAVLACWIAYKEAQKKLID